MEQLIENLLLTFEHFYLTSEFSSEDQFIIYTYQGYDYKIHDADYPDVCRIIGCIVSTYAQN